LANKEEESEIERRRFIQKWDKKVDEQERERQEWAEMYQQMQRDMINVKQQLNDKENGLTMTLKQRTTFGDDNFGGNLSFKGSPDRLGMSSGRNPDVMLFN
jgi:hypothetical protein